MSTLKTPKRPGGKKHGSKDLLQIQRPFQRPINFSRLLNDIPLGTVLLDVNRRVVFLNQALEAMIGLTLKEAQGLPCFHVLRTRTCLRNCPADPSRISPEPVCCESDLINRDRKLIPIRMTVAPVYDRHDKIIGFMENIEDLRSLRELDPQFGHASAFGNIIGKSPQMERMLRILPVLAQSDSSILITGETGTGKDLLAEAVHQGSERAKGPFIKVNCGALPETLLESELFGHKRGAFTGAVSDKPGRFHLAHNGTLYLTEIGDLPLTLQVKLLTFLDDKTVFPLGSTKGFEADVRIIAATHHDLEQMVRNGSFRKDLFFRLNVLRLQIPPLREREGDVRLLLEYFLSTFSSKFNSGIRGFSAQALKILLEYDYPGNVRELKNILEYAVNICRENKISPKHLPTYLIEPRPDLTPPASAPGMETALPQRVDEGPEFGDTGRNWPELERKMITDALLKTKGRKNRAATMLGWARSTLWRKMKQYGIDG